MTQRILFVVVLLMLTVHATVGQFARVSETLSAELSPKKTSPDSASIPEAWPPVEDDARDTEAPETGDDLQGTHPGLLTFTLFDFTPDTYIHPDLRELEGAADRLLKPPPEQISII